MIGLTSLFIRANGAITANPTAEEYHLDEIDDPVSLPLQKNTWVVFGSGKAPSA